MRKSNTEIIEIKNSVPSKERKCIRDRNGKQKRKGDKKGGRRKEEGGRRKEEGGVNI